MRGSNSCAPKNKCVMVVTSHKSVMSLYGYSSIRRGAAMHSLMIAGVALAILGAATQAQASMTASNSRPIEPGCTIANGATDADITGDRPAEVAPTLSSANTVTNASVTTPATNAIDGTANHDRRKTEQAGHWNEVVQRVEERAWRKPMQRAADESKVGSLKRAFARLERVLDTQKVRRSVLARYR
jgi:hypothetical protein